MKRLIFNRAIALMIKQKKKKLYMDFKEGCINIPYCKKIIDRLLKENRIDENNKVNGSLNPFEEPSSLGIIILHLPTYSRYITHMFGLTPEETFHVIYTLQTIFMGKEGAGGGVDISVGQDINTHKKPLIK